MRIEIVVEKDKLRHWLCQLSAFLEKSTGAEVVFRVVDPKEQFNRGLKVLLLVEALFQKHRMHPGFKSVGVESICQDTSQDTPADCTIDLSSGGFVATSGKTIQVRYNGHQGENRLLNELLSKGTPLIEIVDVSTGKAIAQGQASLEAAAGLAGAVEAVYSRVAFLVERSLRFQEEGVACQKSSDLSDIGFVKALNRAARETLISCIRKVYRVFFFPSHWHVGWRFTAGGGVATTNSLAGEAWQVLPSPHDHFYADPFPFEKEGRHYIFFEDLDQKTQKGVISYVEMTDDGPKTDAKVVLEEDWHLSYPSIFERDGEIWMMPESSNNREVALYRAVDFPIKWEKHAVLLSDVEAADATIVEHESRLWMFAVIRDGVGGYSDTLNIYHANNLLGPWEPHQANPVIVNDRTARPAGEMFVKNGKLCRPIQDCRHGYGAAVSLASIEKLTPTSFEQIIQETITPGDMWSGRKFHTLNKSGKLEVIDGCKYRLRSKILSKIFNFSI